MVWKEFLELFLPWQGNRILKKVLYKSEEIVCPPSWANVAPQVDCRPLHPWPLSGLHSVGAPTGGGPCSVVVIALLLALSFLEEGCCCSHHCLQSAILWCPVLLSKAALPVCPGSLLTVSSWDMCMLSPSKLPDGRASLRGVSMYIACICVCTCVCACTHGGPRHLAFSFASFLLVLTAFVSGLGHSAHSHLFIVINIKNSVFTAW